MTFNLQLTENDEDIHISGVVKPQTNMVEFRNVPLHHGLCFGWLVLPFEQGRDQSGSVSGLIIEI